MGTSRKISLAEAMKWSDLTPAVLQKYLTNDYNFINIVPRVVHRTFLEFFEIFIFPTPGQYLQTSARK